MSPVRTLLADDSPEFVRAALSFLSNQPRIRVVGVAADGADAISKSAELGVELVLMDLAMPRMAGLEATRRVKATATPPQVIVVTLYDDPEYRALAAAVGADGFVSKADFAEQFPLELARVIPDSTAQEGEDAGGD
jgi:two-component system invasion response regulator UvrY